MAHSELVTLKLYVGKVLFLYIQSQNQLHPNYKLLATIITAP
jgi:hypothetical protein